MGFWQFATGGGSGGGTGDVVGPASSTDNAIARFDGATGKLLQNSDVTISDLAAGAVTITAGKGTAITLKNTNPDATTGASVAGDPIAITAGGAVASTDTAGAAAGGAVILTAGNAARNASGNANGGDISLVPGTGIGTGTAGNASLTRGNFITANTYGIGLGVASASVVFLASSAGVGGGGNSLSVSTGGSVTQVQASQYAAQNGGNTTGWYSYDGMGLASGGVIVWSSSATSATGTYDTRLSRIAAGQVAVANQTNGMANNIKIATTTVNASGATSTASNLVPAGCILLGVTTRVTTAITSGDGGTSVNIGNGTDADMYGAAIAFALGTTTNLASHTASALAFKSAAESVVFTCVGGTFNGGVWRVCAHYLDLTAPTS